MTENIEAALKPFESLKISSQGSEETESSWLNTLRDTEPGLLESDVRPRSQGFLPAKPPGDSSWNLQHGNPVHSQKLVLSVENPFKGLRISSTEPVNSQSARESCPRCCKSRKYFCYTCYVPIKSLHSAFPKVKLPIKIDVVKHSREVEGKSTAVHAAVLAPDDVTMYTYPDIPDYSKESAILVFPGDRSQKLEQIINSVADDGDVTEVTLFPYTKVVFIDSTWNQCYGMVQDSRLSGLPRVEIMSRNTIFWRYQKGKPKEYLATIEAIYYFLVDFHNIVLKSDYLGEYDNLLFLFKFMYNKIHELYDHDSLRAYTRD